MAVEVERFRTVTVAVANAEKRASSGRAAAALVAGAVGGRSDRRFASYYLNNSSYSVEVSALATYRPPQVTTIYADDGETVLAEFAIEKRIPVKIQDVPDKVTDALLAIEDYRFRDHIGIDPYRIVGAVFKNITTGKTKVHRRSRSSSRKTFFSTKTRPTHERSTNGPSPCRSSGSTPRTRSSRCI